MASRINQFKDSISTYAAGTDSTGNWLTDAVGNVTKWVGDLANPYEWNAVKEFDQSTPQSRGQNPFLTQIANDASQVNEDMAVAGALAAPMIAFEAGNRGFNTVVGGTILAASDYAPWAIGLRAASGNDIYVNPLARDGFQWEDILGSYRLAYGNEKPLIGRNGLPVLDADGKPVMEVDAPTPGQVLSSTFGRLAINAVDSVLPADTQQYLDNKVMEDVDTALADPANERGLYSWMSGLHSEFNIENKQMRDSAYNQGIGRWISGSADAAIQWFVGYDVLALQGAKMAGRSLFMRSIRELSDINAAEESLNLHRAFLRGEEGGQKTNFGSLMESLVRMNETQILRHQLAKKSTDPALVARTFGSATTFDEAADRFLALSGDLRAIDRLFETDKVLGDTMRLNYEQLAETREAIDAFKALDSNQNNVFFNQFIDRYQKQADRLEGVLNQAKIENKSLESAIAGLDKNAGLPSTLRFSDIQLSKLKFGPNSAARMESKALRAAERATGTHLWKTDEFKTGGTFGRTIRVWQSAGDYMRTNRIKGFVDLTDSTSVFAELDSSMMTLPMFRALQKLEQSKAFLPGTDQLVSDFREEIIGKLTSARTPTERMNAWNEYEERTWNALLSYYNIDAADAQGILNKYHGLRDVVTEVAKAKGYIIDSGEINVIPELQSLLAQGMPTMDFHFFETLFRLERGSSVMKRGKDWASVSGSRGLAAFDAIWRPLVLMRLGYTVRNVAEGNLRELAAFGSLGSFTDRGMGTRAIAGNSFARWAAGVGRGMDRAVSLRQGSLRKKKILLDTAQKMSRKNYLEVKKLNDRESQVLGVVTKRADRAEELARRQLLAEARDAAVKRVGVAWEKADTEALGEIDEIVRQSQEMIVPVENVRPLMNRGGSGKRSNFVAGFDTQDTAAARLINEEEAALKGNQDALNASDRVGRDPIELLGTEGEADDSIVKQYLNVEERNQFDEMLAAANGDGIEDWQAQLLDELYTRATARATREAMRNGDTVVRIVDPTSGLYQIIHNPSEVMWDDIANGNIYYLPKENMDKIEYVRANVYGGLVDLRRPKSVKPSTEGMDLRKEATLESMLYEDEPEYLFAGSDQDLARLYDSIFPGQQPHALSIPTSSPNWRASALAGELEELETIVKLIEDQPDIADAIALRRMLSELPEDMRKWFEESGVLISNEKLKSLSSKYKKLQDVTDLAEAEKEAALQQIQAKVLDEEYWQSLGDSLGYDMSLHTGFKIDGDVLSANPVNTEQNVGNFLGVGFYTTLDPEISSGYFFTRVIDPKAPDAEPVIYAIPHSKRSESRFFRVDDPVGDRETETFLQEIFAEMLQANGLKYSKKLWSKVDREVFREDANRFFPLAPDAEAVAAPITIADFKAAMEKVIEEEGNASLYEIQMTWVDAMRNRGFNGIRHTGGQNQKNYFRDQYTPHEVFIFYGDGTEKSLPKLTRVDDLSEDMIKARDLVRRFEEAQDLSRGAKSDLRIMQKVAPFSPNALNAANLSAKNKAIIAEYMKQNGVGRILIDDAYSPNGYQMLSSPDMISVSTDQVDAMLPSGLIGKDYIDNTLPVLEREALVRQPTTLQASNLSDVDLMGMFDRNRGVVNILRGTSSGTPYERALLARKMEILGYTHAQVGAADSNTFTNVSELVASRDGGAAYGSMIGQDEISQRRNLILANDDVYADLDKELGELRTAIDGAEERYLASMEEAKSAAAKLQKRLGKRATGQPLKAPLGSGKETFRGQFNEFTVDGPFSANNQGSLNASLASAGDTVMANLYGFTDYAMMALRKSNKVVTYSPGSQYYFDTLAEQINRYWRNDLIGMALIRGETDDQIINTLFSTKQGRAYIRDVEGFDAFKGFIDADRLTEDARQDLAQLIVDRRESLSKFVPDEEVRQHLVDNEVTALYLQGQLGWRADMPDIVGRQLVGANLGITRKMTGRIMHMLGTVPENALVRHPFYRARWREEMQRQADLYSSQGIVDFSEAQLNAMNQVAKKWALKQTNETLYTIQRLSTPAHMFKFVIPFFPAWASTMRFWLLRMPVEQPQNIARYAMLWDAPESAGWVYDEDGNPVQGQDNIVGKVASKISGGEKGSILIRVDSPALREKIASVTGGNTDIRIPKGSLDMMLQGETFWFPGMTPFAAIPTSWLAAQMPDVATAFETGKLREIPILKSMISPEVEDFVSERGLTNPIYRALVPFGMPTKDKDLVDVAASYIAPAAVDKFYTAWRGMSSSEFASAAKEIHRTRVTDWELGGREGPEPDFIDSVNDTRNFYYFRGGINLTMPFAAQFQTKYKFYIDEARRIDRETFAAGGTYDEANKEFLRLYGPTFFKYTQSLSAGGSGMSATVGEFKEFERDPRLMADLAEIGDDASFITMATRPFAEALNEDGFDGAVYSWQMNRLIEGTNGKYLRGGQVTELPTTRANRELGWMYFDKNMEMLNALAAERGTTVDQDPSLLQMKQGMVTKIAQQLPEWFDDYKDIGGNRFIQSNTALQKMVDSGYFEAHADVPYAQALMAFYEGRKVFVAILQQRKAAGGSASLDAKSNASVKAVYLNWVEKLRASDTSGNFGNTWDRFFQSDPLAPIPALEAAN